MPLYLYCSLRWSWKSVSTHVSTSPGWADTSVPGDWTESGRGPSTAGSTHIPFGFLLLFLTHFLLHATSSGS
ncbi:hypothetical protein ACRRTK_007182 [Alexandromys fortis]